TRRLVRSSHIAWLAAATHVVAAAGMLFLLRRGLPGFPEEERLAYIASHRAAWLGGWLVWQLAAVSLMGFYGVLALRLRGVLSVTAMACAAAGLSLDIACESRYMGVLPELRGEAFAALDRELEVLIGYGANGLYTVALVLLAIAGWRVLPKLALVLFWPVAASGFALAVVSLLHDAWLETVTSAILFPLFTLFIVVIALWLQKEESS
ncbi:MAG TPA: hypothetical protein VFP80_03340, partial [Thermoanaerobaculia bacterium]|nr:hypothetical protein [Thermoanaerobaculia bacterium]